MYKLLLRFMVISDVYRTIIWNKTAFTKYCLTEWISKIHWLRLYQVNFMGQAGITNATVYKTKPIFTGLGHGKLS